MTATSKLLTTAAVFVTLLEQSPLGFFTIHRTVLWNYYSTMVSAHKAGDYLFFQILNYMKNHINMKTKAPGRKSQVGNWKTGLPVLPASKSCYPLLIVLELQQQIGWAGAILNPQIIRQKLAPFCQTHFSSRRCLAERKDFQCAEPKQVNKKRVWGQNSEVVRAGIRQITSCAAVWMWCKQRNLGAGLWLGLLGLGFPNVVFPSLLTLSIMVSLITQAFCSWSKFHPMDFLIHSLEPTLVWFLILKCAHESSMLK